MKKAEVKVYKERLLALRARLRGDVNQMADAALNKSRTQANGDLSSMPIHMADIGSDNFEQEFTLSLMESEEGTLGQIETSLERIEDGTYGQCEECGTRIPKQRLNAIPYASLCVRKVRSWQRALPSRCRPSSSCPGSCPLRSGSSPKVRRTKTCGCFSPPALRWAAPGRRHRSSMPAGG